MPFNPIKFFQPAYLFDLRPYTYDNTIKTMLIFFAVLTLIGIGAKIYKKMQQLEKFQAKLLDKIISFFITLGLLGLGLTWLRYERVHILSARFWLVVWLVVLIIWLYQILKYWIKVVPEAKKHSEERKMFKKYLPK